MYMVLGGMFEGYDGGDDRGESTVDNTSARDNRKARLQDPSTSSDFRSISSDVLQFEDRGCLFFGAIFQKDLDPSSAELHRHACLRRRSVPKPYQMCFYEAKK